MSHTYLLLVAPSANRVYGAAAPTLMAAELTALAPVFVPGIANVAPVELGGVDYLAFTADDLDDRAVTVLSSLSSVMAVFRHHVGTGDKVFLEPIDKTPIDRFGSDLVTIQKYAGKTNEHFTRLLLNVTAAATSKPERLLDGSLSVLDPMCGRGTTLTTALTYGLSTTGIDLDRGDYQAFSTFLQTYLKQGRYKHTVKEGALTVHGKSRGRKLTVELAADKADFKDGRVQTLTYLATDSTKLDGVVKAESHHVIVADTPYGVQHGSHGDKLARSPLGLLGKALPGWTKALRTGGAIGLAYNRHVAAPEAMAELLTEHKLSVVQAPGYDGFRHRVDASIDRDIIVARKG